MGSPLCRPCLHDDLDKVVLRDSDVPLGRDDGRRNASCCLAVRVAAEEWPLDAHGRRGALASGPAADRHRTGRLDDRVRALRSDHGHRCVRSRHGTGGSAVCYACLRCSEGAPCPDETSARSDRGSTAPLDVTLRLSQWSAHAVQILYDVQEWVVTPFAYPGIGQRRHERAPEYGHRDAELRPLGPSEQRGRSSPAHTDRYGVRS